MKILFGKPKLQYCPSVDGVPDGNWVDIDTPKEDSTNLESSEGTDLEAKEEGGEVVDRIGQASSYSLSFELFKKKGEAFPMSENESRGVVSGEYALRVLSDIDSEAPGIQIDRASVKTARLYSPGDTYRKQYTFAALKPNAGDTVKDVENTKATADASAGSCTVTLIESGMTVPTTHTDFSTATVSGTTLSLTLASGKTSGVIELTGSSAIQIVTVTKASA